MIVPPEIEIGEAIAELEELRERLSAERVLAEWPTASGAVAIIVPGPHIMVEGCEVPLQRREG